MTPKSGLVGLATGFALGMVRLVSAGDCIRAQRRRMARRSSRRFVDINWLYFSFLLFVFTCALIFVVSQFTPKASPEQLAGLTYRSVSAQQNAEDRQTLRASGRFSTPA